MKKPEHGPREHVRTRPDKFTIAEVCEALRKSQGLISYTAKALCTSTQTVERYCHKYATCQQARDGARDAVLDLGEAKLVERVNAGEGWAVCFLLKTLGKRRGYVERHEVTGPDGKVSDIQNLAQLMGSSPETLAKAKELAALLAEQDTQK